MAKARPDYGLDAPGVQLWLATAGIAALFAALLADMGWVRVPHFALARSLAWPGAFLLATAAVMFWSSKVGKFWVRDRLVRDLALTGGEQVLDVGCGRGLMLVACARRLTTGTAVGIDLWSQADLSANSPEAARRNAELEGVTDRIRIDTGDARGLPYADASFDAVTSMTVIHNIKDAAGREKAIAEISRVLKPGGRLALFDISHALDYDRQLRAMGWTVEHSAPILLWAQPGFRLTAAKP